MLVGLLFAIEEAAGDPARLVATLPFAGATLIEHQARQLLTAGAAQIVVIGERQDPELLGALHRIGRRGVAVDAVRSAAEAAAAVHPLARLVMLADGLVTTDAVVRLVARDGGEALLVVPADAAPPGLERIGGASAWAGAARFPAARLSDLARLPADYDPPSTLIRIVESSGSVRLPLPPTAARDGHGVERDAASLALRGRRIVASAVAVRPDWASRFVVAPFSRAVLPTLVARRVDTAAVAGAAAAIAVVAAAALMTAWFRSGLALAVVAVLASHVGIAMAELRDERGLRGAMRLGGLAAAATAVLLLGWRYGVVRGDGTALAVAASLVAATALVERADARRSWRWSGAPSGLLLVTAATMAGWPVLGLVLASVAVFATLGMTIETLRSRDLAGL